MKDLAGKTVVITGAASGIGKALADSFAAQGAKLMLADVEERALQSVATTLEQNGADVAFQRCDVTKAEDIEALAQATEDHFGDIHVVCNNAGVFVGGQLWEASIADYEWVLGVNVWGVIHGQRSFIPRMIRHGGEACIVNTASLAGFTSGPFSGIYNMSKHAVVGMSECLHHELSMTAPQVKVVLVCPELVNTQIAQADRNRPEALNDAPDSDFRSLAVQGLDDSTASAAAVEPSVLAERTVQAVKDDQFYVFPPAENPWWGTTMDRLDDIRERRNPRFTVPGG